MFSFCSVSRIHITFLLAISFYALAVPAKNAWGQCGDPTLISHSVSGDEAMWSYSIEVDGVDYNIFLTRYCTGQTILFTNAVDYESVWNCVTGHAVLGPPVSYAIEEYGMEHQWDDFMYPDECDCAAFPDESCEPGGGGAEDPDDDSGDGGGDGDNGGGDDDETPFGPEPGPFPIPGWPPGPFPFPLPGPGTSPPPPSCSLYPIVLGTGVVQEKANDLVVDTPVFKFRHSRNYNSMRAKDGGGEINDPNGLRWQSTIQGPYLTTFVTIHPVGAYPVLHVNYYPDAYSKHTFDEDGGSYTSPAGLEVTLTKTGSGSNEVYTLEMTRTGEILIFYGYSASIDGKTRGRLKERTNRRYVAAGLSGMEYNYDNGRLIQVTTADPQAWSIEYSYNPFGLEFNRLQKIEVKNGSGAVIKKVEYTYFGDVAGAPSSLGKNGDLLQVKVSELASDNASWKVRYTQYRYFTNASSLGKNHQLKMVLESDAIEQINKAGNSAVDTPEELLTKNDNYVVTGSTQLVAYANRSFTYYTSDENTSSSLTTPWGTQNLNSFYEGNNLNEFDSVTFGRVKTEVVNGSCATCSGGSGDSLKYTYFYMSLNTGDVPSEVNTITVEDVQDVTGTALYRNIYGLNHKHQELRNAKIENPTAGTVNAWCRSTLLNSNYQVIQRRSPAAHTLVDSNSEIADFLNPTSGTNDANTVNSSDGLIEIFEYDANKNQTASLVKKGSSGTASYVAAADYGNGTTIPTYLVTASYRYPQQTSTRANGIATSYAYTFWDVGMKQVQKRTTTQTAVPTAENGPNVASVTEDYYDRLGRLRWTKDALGYVNYMSYQPDTGGLAYQALDVNPSSMPGSSTGNNTKWVSAADDGSGTSYGSGGIPTRTGAITPVRAMVTTNEYDSQGRRIKTVTPGDRRYYTVYEPNRILSIPFWNNSNQAGLPTSVTVTNNAGQMLETYRVSAAFTSFLSQQIGTTSEHAPKGFSSQPTQNDYVSWTRYGYEPFTNRRSTVDRYHDIPSSGTGTLSTNFDRSVSKYDNRGRLSYSVQTVSGTSTSSGKEQVSQRVYDFLDRVIETKMGVSSSSHDMGSSYTTLPTMTTISKTIYDDGNVGNSYVTKTQSHFGTGANDYTGVKLKRTYRGHVRGQEPFSGGSAETADGPFPVVDLDWEGKSTATAQYKTTAPTWATVLTGDGYTAFTTTATNRGTYATTSYDDLGRPYQQNTYAVDTTNGSLYAALQSNNYYDLAGQLVASGQVGSTSTETAYDALGRAYQSRMVYALESTKYSSGAYQYRDPQPKPGFSSSNTSAMTGGDDQVITMSHSVYDDIGNVTESHSFAAFHSDTTGMDLSNNDDYVRTSTYSWYDSLDRLTTTGEYGSGDTAGGAGTYYYFAVPSRPGTAPSSSTNLVLVSKYSYEATTGRSSVTTSPLGRQSKTYYDDYGRSIFVAENHDNFDPTSLSTISDGSDASKDRVTKTTYDGLGNTTTLVAYNGSSTATQTTRYLYEDTRNARWNTNTIYPDSTDTTSAGTNQVKVSYNVDGTQATRTDQRGAVIDYAYDDRRRPIIQKVSNLGSGGENVDGNVRSISSTYDSLGRREKTTTHGNQVTTNTDTTNVKNQVQNVYTGLSTLTVEYQQHGSAVSTTTSPKSQLGYDGSNSGGLYTDNFRPEQITYPNGRVVYSDYDTAGTYTDLTNMTYRLRETNSSGTILTHYRYLGDGRIPFVGFNANAEPAISLNYGGSYSSWDRFGRIKYHGWLDGPGTPVELVRINYTYDYDSNRTSAEDVLAATNSQNYDEKYAYDGLNRLTKTERGNLSSGSIVSKTFEEDFSLDQLNNWAAYYRDLNGDGTDDLVQTRVHNDVNEITSISASVGTNWADPTYDAAGNMVTCPKPNDPANSFTLRWDAWNRLVKVLDGANTVVEYEYDGMNRRIVKKLYTGGTLTQTRHRYHAPGQDQVIEERVDASSNADRQFTWGTRYIDDLVMRTRDTNADGTLDETLYALTDITYDVVALTDATGAVVERFLYDPYGKSTVLDANFAVDSDGISDYDWEYRFTSREYDKETGLDYFRARYYASHVGRFVNRDPLGYPDGMNAYAGYFVPNNVDPTGLEGTYVPPVSGTVGPTECECRFYSDQIQPEGFFDKFWHGSLGNRASSLDEVIARIKSSLGPHGCLKDLNILSHNGVEGLFVFADGDGAQHTAGQSFSPEMKKFLSELKSLLCKESKVEFMQCDAALGDDGTTGLCEIAKATGAMACGFTSGVIPGRQYFAKKKCCDPQGKVTYEGRGVGGCTKKCKQGDDFKGTGY